MNRCLFTLILLAAAFRLSADTLRMTCGDVISGTVTRIADGKIHIDTAYAGALAIDRSEVESVTYSEPGRTFYARTDVQRPDKAEAVLAEADDGSLRLVPVGGQGAALVLDEVATLWPTDGTDPDFPPVKLWSVSASLGLTGHSGASDDLSFSAALDASRSTEKTTLKLYGSYYKSRSEGVETAKQLIGGLDLEHRPWERHSWYVRDEIQHNPYSNYKLRNVLGVGYGFYLWNTVTSGRTSLLRLRAGFAQAHTEYYTRKPGGDRVTENDLAMDFGILFHYDFTNGLGWNTEITYTPLIDDWEKATLIHESKLTYTLNEFSLLSDRLKNVALEAGLRNEIQTRPAPGTRHSDNTWYLRLSKTW